MISYGVGYLVYLADSATVVGTSKKLRPPWKGPYLLERVLSPMLFQIKGPKRSTVVHHD